MLQIFLRQGEQLRNAESLDEATVAEPLVWVDLLNPSVEEDKAVEKVLGIVIPSQAEMMEIELSSRLYSEDGAEFMTISALKDLDGLHPATSPVTFILKRGVLVTVRYADPKPFRRFTQRCQRPSTPPLQTGEQVMLGIIEAIVDRTADFLERVGADVDAISRRVFKPQEQVGETKEVNVLQKVLQRIGSTGDTLTMIQESLISVTRMFAFHSAIERTGIRPEKEDRQRIKLIQRDVIALGDHATALSERNAFLLDATLGLINLEQNQIIKLFSVAAVVMLPPTLVASIYGMNFAFMPELAWRFGYPFALGLMLVSAVLPYLYFKRKGWL